MTLQDLREDERKLIALIRGSHRFCTIKVEKRPTPQYPNGELIRVTTEDSLKLDEIILPVESK